MLQTLISLAKMLLDGTVPLIILGIWLLLKILCWVLGAIGIKTIAKKKGIELSAYPYFPGWQICASLRLIKKERLAKRANFLLWWGWVLFAICVASLVWAIVFYLREAATFGVILLIVVGVIAAIFAVCFYFTLRILEFTAVFKLVKKKSIWMLFLCGFGTFFLIPIQRIYLFKARA